MLDGSDRRRSSKNRLVIREASPEECAAFAPDAAGMLGIVVVDSFNDVQKIEYPCGFVAISSLGDELYIHSLKVLPSAPHHAAAMLCKAVFREARRLGYPSIIWDIRDEESDMSRFIGRFGVQIESVGEESVRVRCTL